MREVARDERVRDVVDAAGEAARAVDETIDSDRRQRENQRRTREEQNESRDETE